MHPMNRRETHCQAAKLRERLKTLTQELIEENTLEAAIRASLQDERKRREAAAAELHAAWQELPELARQQQWPRSRDEADRSGHVGVT